MGTLPFAIRTRPLLPTATLLDISGSVWYITFMVKTLEQAIAVVANLPEADQEQIGRKLLSHVEKLRQLRADIDQGLQALDEGKGTVLDIEQFLQTMNRSYGRS